MLNYIKSELYRISHSAAIYITALIMAALPLIMNLVLYFFAAYDPNFPYSTTSHSFSYLVSEPMLFCYCTVIIVSILYENERKNGNLKNVIAFGISREKIFIAQFLISFLVSTIILIITETVYILSALFLLKHEGPANVMDMLHEIVAVFPIALAALVLGITVLHMFEKSIVGILVWLCILVLIPEVLFYISLAAKPIQKIVMWMPQNFFNLMRVNMAQCNPIWDTTQGLAKCLISGTIGFVIFAAAGILSIRKKEF